MEMKSLRVTAEGQVTIPRGIREALGISAGTEADFVEEGGRFYIVKTEQPSATGKFGKLRGIASAKVTTDEILCLTREP